MGTKFARNQLRSKGMGGTERHLVAYLGAGQGLATTTPPLGHIKLIKFVLGWRQLGGSFAPLR